MTHMRLRRSSATTLGLLVLSTPLLASCSFGDYATERPYTPAAGTYERSEDVDVLGAVVVAAADGSGTLVATLANNSPTDEIALTKVAAANGVDITAADVDETVEAQGAVNLADAAVGGVVLTGSAVQAGQFVPLELSFSDGETLTIDVPVVTACHMWEGLDLSEPAAGAETYSCEYQSNTPVEPAE